MHEKNLTRSLLLIIIFAVLCFAAVFTIRGERAVCEVLCHEESQVFSASGRSACIAMERETQTVLHENNADVRLPMASTTKIMTALLICEDCNPDEVVIVPDKAINVEGSSIYLKKGEEIDIRDLLYGLMLRSGNDAANALALIHSGSLSVFADRMNERAREIGAADTSFKNPSGLPDEEHYTTARDLCKIACTAMNNALFREIVGTKSWHGKYRSYANKNKTLFNYAGATGIKTGYTLKAGRCLVSSALKSGMEVVCVVLNESDMYNKSFSVLDDCFENFELVEADREKIFLCGGKPCRTRGFKVVLKKGEETEYRCLPGVCENDIVGKLQIYSQNNLIFTADLYSIV